MNALALTICALRWSWWARAPKSVIVYMHFDIYIRYTMIDSVSIVFKDIRMYWILV